MQNPNQKNNNTKAVQSHPNPKLVWHPTIGMGLISVGGAILAVGLIVASDGMDELQQKQFVSTHVINVLLLVAVVVQAYISHKQWTQTRELFELVERPIVVVEHAVGGFPEVNFVLPGITLVNKGRMAAKDIVVIFEAQIGVHEIYPTHTTTALDVDLLATAETINVMPPPNTSFFTFLELGEADKSAVLNGDTPLFIYGKGMYYDMGKRNRHEISPFVFTFNCKTKKFARNYALPYAWKIQENLRKPAPWRPKGDSDKEKVGKEKD